MCLKNRKRRWSINKGKRVTWTHIHKTLCRPRARSRLERGFAICFGSVVHHVIVACTSNRYLRVHNGCADRQVGAAGDRGCDVLNGQTHLHPLVLLMVVLVVVTVVLAVLLQVTRQFL